MTTYKEIEALAQKAPSGDAILAVSMGITELLLRKNIAYGNSALSPVRIFSKADTAEQIKVRLDDKLSRFARGSAFPGDNDIDDLLGYLILLKIAMQGLTE